MAVTPAVPLLKSQPDMSKLNAFAGYMVSVTKHLGPKGTPGTAVVPTQKMEKDKLLALQVHLPLQYGAGYYMFNVTDEGGTGNDEWMVKLGTDVTSTQEGMPMVGQPPFQPPAPGMPLDADVKQIMPRFFFNEALGLLTTPWGETVQWRMGDPWPRPPASAGHLSLVPQNATPWSWPQQQPGGWGGYPATETKSPELEAMKLQIAEDRRRAEEADRRREDREREDRRVEDAKREREASEARFEKLVTLLTAKPTGPTETEQRLLRETEELRRRTEAAEARAADERKEAQRREEVRAAEDRHREQIQLVREEMKAVTAAATANKTDPMMTLFGTILQTQSASATETARMIRETSDRAAASSERSTTQVLQLAQASRDNASEASKAAVDGMKNLLEMQTGVFTNLLELQGTGNQPWYAGVIQEGVGKIGLLGQALMEKNALAQQQPQYMPPQRIVQGRPGQQPQRVPGQPMAPQVGAPTAPPVPIGTGTRPVDAEFDPETEEFVFPDGWRVKQVDVQQKGWVAVLKRRPQAAAAAPLNGTNSAPVATAPLPTVIVPDAVVPPAPVAMKPAKSAKKKRGAPAAAPPPAPVSALPPPANGQGYSLEELRAMEPDQVAEVVNPLDDTMLFGGLLPYVTDMRVRVASGLPPAKTAEFVLGTRQYIHSFGASPPPAFELLAAGHLEVLIERILPDAPEEYQDAVIDLMEKKLEAENPQATEIEAQ